MSNQIYELNIVGHRLRYLLRDQRAADCFPEPLRPCVDAEYDITLSDEDVILSKIRYPLVKTEAWREYKMLVWPTADYLLEHRACIVHSVSISWLGKAWLLCAPSGTGKSTQFRRWRQLGGAEVRLINGDMSVVSLEPDGIPRVWDSPWTGKECWIGDPGPVPLGGIVFLEQAEKNELQRLNPSDAVRRILHGICSHPKTEQAAFTLAALADEMLKRPVWFMKNRGDTASAQLIMDAIKAEGSMDE